MSVQGLFGPQGLRVFTAVQGYPAGPSTCMHASMYTYIYIYMYIEREGEREREREGEKQNEKTKHMCVNACNCVCVYVAMYLLTICAFQYLPSFCSVIHVIIFNLMSVYMRRFV